jgi:hypothetical protein
MTPGPREFFSVDSTPGTPLLTQRFIDADVERTATGSECFNIKNQYTVTGFVPDWGESDHERLAPFITYGEESTGDNVHVPTHYVVRKALSAVPEMLQPPDWRSVLHRAGYRKWVKEGWKEPKLTLYSGFSLPNLLLEWNQTRQLVKSWTSRDELIKRWHQFNARRHRLPKQLQAAANERLAHVYGTELLLQDAKILFDLLTQIDQKVSRFLKVCSKINRLYKRVPLRVTLPLPSTLGIPFNEFGLHGCSLDLVGEVDVEGRACLYYTADPPEFSQFWSRVRQLCDAYGLRLDAGIPWDAIKYSFVIDWFYNVGPWLHEHMSKNWYQMDIDYIAFCNSAKMRFRRQLIWNRPVWRPGVGGIEPVSTEIIRQDSTIYRRSYGDELPLFGKMEFARNQKPWSIRRVINATALAVQKAHVPARKLSKSFFGYVD